MATSGVKVHQECEDIMKAVQSRKIRYALFKLNDTLTEIIPDKAFGREEVGCSGQDVLESLKKELPPSEPRYAVVDFAYPNEEGHKRDAVVFVIWCPEDSNIKKKMVYAASKQYLYKACGAQKQVQANDMEDLAYSNVRGKCIK